MKYKHVLRKVQLFNNNVRHSYLGSGQDKSHEIWTLLIKPKVRYSSNPVNPKEHVKRIVRENALVNFHHKLIMIL